MILRSAKIVVDPRRADETVPLYRDYTDSFALRQPGIVGVRLLRHLTMPNKFFLHSWWASAQAMEEAVRSEAYAAVLSEARTDFLERLSVWPLDVLDADPRPLLPAHPKRVVSRLAKMTLRPDADGGLEELYYRITDRFTRQVPGCLRVQLFRDRQVRNVYFVQTYWTDAEAMVAARELDELKVIRKEALHILEERMAIWEMEIVADSVRMPMFDARG